MATRKTAPTVATRKKPAAPPRLRVLAIVDELCRAHGARLERRQDGRLVAHHPVSAERFVAAARACPVIDQVQVHSTGIELVLVATAPEPETPAED